MEGNKGKQMIATITLNPAIDKSIFIQNFTIGKTNRAHVDRIDPGGKGINVAKVLKQLGCQVITSGFLAGNNGRYISSFLTEQGIMNDFIVIPGETRQNLKIIDPIKKTITEINEPGAEVDECYLKQLMDKVKELASQCQVIVFSGSLPPGLPDYAYKELILLAKERGTQTILDTGGIALWQGLAACPTLIKPNKYEVEEVLQVKVSEDKLVNIAERLLASGPEIVVISLGARGALLASRQQKMRAYPPVVEANSTVGAGDAMVAVFAYGLERGLSLTDTLRLATAVSAAAAAAHGSEVGDIELAKNMLPEVKIQEI